MAEIVLKNKTDKGVSLEAIFAQDKGMNLLSYKRGNTQVIDQSTKNLFEERFAGLGALIGPHFHHRNPHIIPAIKDESLFPHIARVKAKGIQEPFSHGIARYAPWTAITFTDTSITAKLTGKDTWNGVPLSQLEGQNFTINFNIELKPTGLSIDLSVVSDTDSLVGTHYYYGLPTGHGKVISHVQKYYNDGKEKRDIPKEWAFDSQHQLTFDLAQSADYTFYPFPNPLEGKITLDAEKYKLHVSYTSKSQENCWQLYHPAGASFVCIEPISSQDPRHPNLTASGLHIDLEIESEGN